MGSGMVNLIHPMLDNRGRSATLSSATNGDDSANHLWIRRSKVRILPPQPPYSGPDPPMAIGDRGPYAIRVVPPSERQELGERLGVGRTAEVFAWRDGTVIKLLRREFPEDSIKPRQGREELVVMEKV